MSSKFQVSGSRLVALGLVIAVAWAYGHWTWRNHERAETIVFGLEGKPFVFRALIPWMAQVLMKIGLPAEFALSALVVCSAIGLFYGLDYLSKSVR